MKYLWVLLLLSGCCCYASEGYGICRVNEDVLTFMNIELRSHRSINMQQGEPVPYLKPNSTKDILMFELQGKEQDRWREDTEQGDE